LRSHIFKVKNPPICQKKIVDITEAAASLFVDGNTRMLLKIEIILMIMTRAKIKAGYSNL
jgi:hypothetical protein